MNITHPAAKSGVLAFVASAGLMAGGGEIIKSIGATEVAGVNVCADELSNIGRATITLAELNNDCPDLALSTTLTPATPAENTPTTIRLTTGVTVPTAPAYRAEHLAKAQADDTEFRRDVNRSLALGTVIYGGLLAGLGAVLGSSYDDRRIQNARRQQELTAA